MDECLWPAVNLIAGRDGSKDVVEERVVAARHEEQVGELAEEATVVTDRQYAVQRHGDVVCDAH